MISMEQGMEIKILRRQGMSLRGIAKETGLAVNTVRRCLLGVEAKVLGRPKGLKKLEVTKEYLEARVQSVYPVKLPVCVLLRGDSRAGYKGSLTQVRFIFTFLKVYLPQIVRFETPPWPSNASGLD